MAYCLSCGKSAKTHDGLCAQCARDFDVSRKRYRSTARQPEMTLQWIADNARRYRTQMANAFIRACDGCQS